MILHATLNPNTPQDEVDDGLSDGTQTFDSDRPRVVRWVDEEELDYKQSGDESLSEIHSNSDVVAGEKYSKLKKDLSKLPLGAIIKARKAIRKTEEVSSSSSEESELDSASESQDEKHSTKKSKETHGRSNKHAPVELSSKRPVTRRRQVVETHQIKARDPRFSNLSGSLDVGRYRSQYAFLSDMHEEELSTLKASFTRARKLLATAPQHLRGDMEMEAERLEKAVKRSESVVNRGKQQHVEYEALKRLKKEEKEKQKAGKKAWWLKKSSEKDIRQHARLDALAESGGKKAVKKAIEKKQRKIGQKEKKSRPFPPPQSTNDTGNSKKRRGDSNDNPLSRSAKRSRFR